MEFKAPREAELAKYKKAGGSVKVRLIPGLSTIHNLSTISHVSNIPIIPDVVRNIVNIPSKPVLSPIIDSGATYSCVNNVDLLVPNSLTIPSFF